MTPNPYGTNTGHGHVWPRPDGVKARCGGPALCKQCAFDAGEALETRQSNPVMDGGDELRKKLHAIVADTTVFWDNSQTGAVIDGQTDKLFALFEAYAQKRELAAIPDKLANVTARSGKPMYHPMFVKGFNQAIDTTVANLKLE